MGQFTEKDSKNISILLKKMSADPKYKGFKQKLLDKSEIAAQASGKELEVSNRNSVASDLATNAALLLADALQSRPKFTESLSRLLSDARQIEGYDIDKHISDTWSHPDMSTESVIVTAMHIFNTSNKKDKGIYSDFIDEVMASSGRNHNKTPLGFALTHGEMEFMSSYSQWTDSKNSNIAIETPYISQSNKANRAFHTKTTDDSYTPAKDSLSSGTATAQNSQIAATMGIATFALAGLYYAKRMRSNNKGNATEIESIANNDNTKSNSQSKQSKTNKNRKRKQRKLRAKERSTIENSSEVEEEKNTEHNQPAKQGEKTSIKQEPPKEIIINTDKANNKSKNFEKDETEAQSQTTAITAIESQTQDPISPISKQPEPKELPPLEKLEDIAEKKEELTSTNATAISGAFSVSAVSDTKSTEELLKEIQAANERAKRAEERSKAFEEASERVRKAELRNKELEQENKKLEAHTQILESKTRRTKKQIRDAKRRGHDEGFSAGIRTNLSEAERAKQWATFERNRAETAEYSAFVASQIAVAEGQRAISAEYQVEALQQQTIEAFNDGVAVGYLEPQYPAYRKGLEDGKKQKSIKTASKVTNESQVQSQLTESTPLSPSSSHTRGLETGGISPKNISNKLSRTHSF